MGYLQSYLNRIRERGNHELASSIEKTARKIGDEYLRTFSFNEDITGLLFGNVQSGKTGQMFGIIGTAADLGFPVFLLLTTDNVVLQEQTLERVQNDLPEFIICGENDGHKFLESELEEPVIIVLKKNVHVLKLWANILKSSQFMQGNPLFILDDEADAASLNTKINQNGISSINRYLQMIKNDSQSSVYLQVTGTPQALLLQSLVSGFRPAFTCTFNAGKGYLGGDFFFPVSGKPECIEYVGKEDERIAEAVKHHMGVSSLLFLEGKKTCTALFHPGVRISMHNKTKARIDNELERLRSLDSGNFEAEILPLYNGIPDSRKKAVSFDQFIQRCRSLLHDGEIKTIVLNGKNEVDSSLYQKGCSIVIGGNTLGRGVTFPALQTIYYTRTAKKPQADTMWQHSRMFGYDRDPELIKVYMTPLLYKLFADINASNKAMIAMMETPDNNHISLYYPEGINPTRSNVLDQENLSVLTGGVNYYPSDPEDKSFEQLDSIMSSFDDQDESIPVSLRIIRKILEEIIPSEDFDHSAVLGALDTIIARKPTAQGKMIVRRNRRIRQGTGALISERDWKIGKRITDRPVLTMYQIEEGYGWKGGKIWVPNIKFPSEMVYFQTES